MGAVLAGQLSIVGLLVLQGIFAAAEGEGEHEIYKKPPG